MFQSRLPAVRVSFLAAGILFLGGCTSLKVSDFAAERPIFQPLEFFSGRTSSRGVMETTGGAPSRIVTTETLGAKEGDILRLEQDLFITGKAPMHRSWRLRQLDAHRYEATANDVVGTIRGEAYGNVFHWEFTLALSPGNPLANVRFSQWMYLQRDGETMVNHTAIRKLGVVVAQVTEQFRRH